MDRARIPVWRPLWRAANRGTLNPAAITPNACPNPPGNTRVHQTEADSGLAWSNCHYSQNPLILMRKLALVVALLRLAVASIAGSAPSSIGDAIVSISVLNVPFFYTTSELVLLRADGTFQDLQYETSFGGAPSTLPPRNGTYTYAPSTSQADQGTITWTTSTSQYSTALTFSTATTGTVNGNDADPFTIYARTNLSGAENVSDNSWVTTTHPSTSGFVIEGGSPHWVLVRGAGPSLAQFGVSSPVAAPQLTIYSGSNAIQKPSAWSNDPNFVAGFDAIFALAGAFQFAPGSTDCAGLYLLNPGAYTAVGATPGPDGSLLTEIYILPYGN